MIDFSTIIGVYNTNDKAQAALTELNATGTPFKNMSIISKADIIEREFYGTSNDNIKNAAVEIGVILGSVIGMLSGLRFFTIPGLGLIYGSGPVVGALAGFDLGLIGGGLITLLMYLGINKYKTASYHKHLEYGKYIITIWGSKETANKAKEVMHTKGLRINLQKLNNV